MARREFVKILEKNFIIMDRMIGRLHSNPMAISGLPRQQGTVLMRLYIGGRARLKDIARRECQTTPNLCATFRKLEKLGLVSRIVDEKDRRNTWYQVTTTGEKRAREIIENFRNIIEEIFANISKDDEQSLIDASKSMNSILIKMENMGDR